jgi:hypothetical protein
MGQTHTQLSSQPCTRCGELMLPGQLLHLDHNDTRTGYLGFSHADCNREAAARKAKAVRPCKPLTRAEPL